MDTNAAHIFFVVILTVIVYLILAAFTASPIPVVGALLVLLVGFFGTGRLNR